MEATFWWGALVGALFGVLATVFIQPLVEGLKRRSASRIRTWLPTKSGGEDLQDIDFFQLMMWSRARPLDPQRHRVERDLTDQLPQQWFPSEALDPVVASIRARWEGEVCEVTHSTVDHGETGDASKDFVMFVRPSQYPDSLALPRLLADDGHWARVADRISRDGIVEALRVAPTQSFFVNLTVTTKRGEVLVTRRSASSASAAGLRSLGVCETMNAIPSVPGHQPETLFQLAYRAAYEELGLLHSDLGPIWFSWYGFGRHHGQFAIAHTQTHLSADEVELKADQAEARWEADAFQWLAVNGGEMRNLARATDHPGFLPLVSVAARDLIRVWPHIGLMPTRH